MFPTFALFVFEFVFVGVITTRGLFAFNGFSFENDCFLVFTIDDLVELLRFRLLTDRETTTH